MDLEPDLATRRNWMQATARKGTGAWAWLMQRLSAVARLVGPGETSPFTQ
jgi:hypothetical protein